MEKERGIYMKKSFLLLTIIVMAIFMAGCKKKEKKDPIIGKWANGSFIYTFNEDGTCNYEIYGTSMKCTYEIDGDKISILYDGYTASFDSTFSIKGNKLNIKDSFGEDTIYERK